MTIVQNNDAALQCRWLLRGLSIIQLTDYSIPLAHRVGTSRLPFDPIPMLLQGIVLLSPPTRDVVSHTLKLFMYDEFVHKTSRVLGDMEAEGFVPADVWTTFALCQAVPGLQLVRHVAALGTLFGFSDEQKHVLCFGHADTLQPNALVQQQTRWSKYMGCMALVPETGGWESRYVFPGVRDAKRRA